MKGWWSSSGELWESFPESLWLPGVLHGVLLELPWWGRSIGRALEEPPDQNGTEPLGAHTSSIACGLNASHKQHCSWWGVAAASWSKQEGKEKSQDNTTTPYKHKRPHWILHLLFPNHCFTCWECFLLGSEGWTEQEEMRRWSPGDKTPETHWWSLCYCWDCHAEEAAAYQVLSKTRILGSYSLWCHKYIHLLEFKYISHKNQKIYFLEERKKKKANSAEQY